MSTIIHPPDASSPARPQPPTLEAGDHLDQKTFHARYEAMPQGTQAELIGGVVYMPSPMKLPHGRLQQLVSNWLGDYEELTPGVQAVAGVTTILGEDSEPQPDCSLYILPERGGQIGISDDQYITGAPELIVEIASSTESYDLHSKKRDYEVSGVCEYVVVAVRQAKVFWFIRGKHKFEETMPHDDGIIRSEVFPGLWLDPKALIEMDRTRLREITRQGCATDAHAEFVNKP